MRERLLVCNDCGNEAYLAAPQLEQAKRDGYECEDCGSHTHQDYGFIETPYPLVTDECQWMS